MTLEYEDGSKAIITFNSAEVTFEIILPDEDEYGWSRDKKYYAINERVDSFNNGHRLGGFVDIEDDISHLGFYLNSIHYSVAGAIMPSIHIDGYGSYCTDDTGGADMIRYADTQLSDTVGT